jgi:hypothetical protein
MEQKIRMELPELVRQLCQRPSMWALSPHFSSVCAYIRGYDHARDGGPLAGFREWLVVRVDGVNNLGWQGLVMDHLMPYFDVRTSPLTAEQESSCLQGLADLFEEFYGFRQEHGITKIHYDYARWLIRKRWYGRSGRSGKNPTDEASLPPP